MPEPTSAPNPKVVASTIGVGVATVAWTLLGVRYPALSDPKLEVAAVPALAMAFTAGCGYLKEAEESVEKAIAGRSWLPMVVGVLAVAALGLLGGAALF